MGEKICLDLFAGLGGFSQAFEEHPDWTVVTVEISNRFEPDIQADVMNLRPNELPDADVVLASPPCTQFSRVAWSHGKRVETDGTPKTGAASDAIALVYHTLGLIKAINPEYWFLENPRGALRWVIGEPTATVDYCRYGHYTQKQTDLWGNHPTSFEYKKCNHGSHSRRDGVTDFELGPSDPAERAKVPRELSKEVLKSVEGDYSVMQGDLSTFSSKT